MPKDSGKDLAANALVVSKTANEAEIMPPDILQQAQLGLDPTKYFAREKVGEALLGHTLGIMVAGNLKMREHLERAADVLASDIMERPLPEDEELACKVMGLKVRAATGLATLQARHISLTTELTNLAELQGRVNLKGTAKKVAPQQFVGTNYVQINTSQPTVASEAKPIEDDSDKVT